MASAAAFPAGPSASVPGLHAPGTVPGTAPGTVPGTAPGRVPNREALLSALRPAEWVFELKRLGNRTPRDLWQDRFSKDFENFLREFGKDGSQNRRSNFHRFVIGQFLRSGFEAEVNPHGAEEPHSFVSGFDAVGLQQGAAVVFGASQQRDEARYATLLVTVDLGLINQWRKLRHEAARSRLRQQNDPSEIIATVANSLDLFLHNMFFEVRDLLGTSICSVGSELLASMATGLDAVYAGELQEASETVKATVIRVQPLRTSIARTVRSIRAQDTGRLITLDAVVTRVSDLQSELRVGVFECDACGAVSAPIEQRFILTQPSCCPKKSCGNRTRWILRSESSIFCDWQKLRIQQSLGPQTSDAPDQNNDANENRLNGAPNGDATTGADNGFIPRTLDVIVREEAVGSCKPGDRVRLTGTVVCISMDNLAAQAISTGRSQQQDPTNNETSIRGLKKMRAKEVTYKLMFWATHVEVSVVGVRKELSGGALNASSRPGGNEANLEGPEGRMIRRLLEIATPPEDAPATPETREFYSLLYSPLLRRFGVTTRARHLKFRGLARSVGCLSALAEALAPEIYGLKYVKKGVLLQLVGGVEKWTADEGLKLRGDINICIVGDPGVAKSQLLRSVSQVADRAVLTAGRSSTAAGLTASVHRSANQNEAVVEAGALMLADRGICCIDEFEKMDPKDLTAIHEAMEQQTISITKAGIQATMNARAAVLAACNPIGGRYDISRPFSFNVRLPPAIISRFDLVFVALDMADEDADRALARHLLCKSADAGETTRLIEDEGELKAYCRCAKAFRPRLEREAKKMLIQRYVSLRQEDAVPGQGMSQRVTVRQLESFIRLSEAVAKLRFCSSVKLEHVYEALQVFVNSRLQIRHENVDLLPEASTEAESAQTDMDDGENEAAQAGRKQGQAPISVAGEDFDQIHWLLLSRIRSLAPGAPELSRDSVIQWFLQSHCENITSEEELATWHATVDRIIGAMLKSHVLLQDDAVDDLGPEAAEQTAPQTATQTARQTATQTAPETATQTAPQTAPQTARQTESQGLLSIHPNLADDFETSSNVLTQALHGATHESLNTSFFLGLGLGETSHAAESSQARPTDEVTSMSEEEFFTYLYGRTLPQVPQLPQPPQPPQAGEPGSQSNVAE